MTEMNTLGVRFGRPPVLALDQVALGRKLVEEGKPVHEAARLLKVHRATLYREFVKAADSSACLPHRS